MSIGKKPKDLVNIYETSFKSICNWVNKLNQGGVEALIDKEKHEKNAKLNEIQKTTIKTYEFENELDRVC